MNFQSVHHCVFLLRELLAKRQMNFCMYLFERIKYSEHELTLPPHVQDTLHCFAL